MTVASCCVLLNSPLPWLPVATTTKHLSSSVTTILSRMQSWLDYQRNVNTAEEQVVQRPLDHTVHVVWVVRDDSCPTLGTVATQRFAFLSAPGFRLRFRFRFQPSRLSGESNPLRAGVCGNWEYCGSEGEHFEHSSFTVLRISMPIFIHSLLLRFILLAGLVKLHYADLHSDGLRVRITIAE